MKRVAERPYPENLLFELIGKESEILQAHIKGLEYAISTLTEREQNILYMRFRDGKTLEYVGKIYGVVKDRVRQIECKALRKLTHHSRSIYYIQGFSVVEARTKLFEELHEKEKELQLELIRKNWEEEQENKRLGIGKGQNIDSLNVEHFNFTVRAYNCLKRAGYSNVLDILKQPKSKLMTIRNLGRKCYNEIEQKLKERGYFIIDDMEVGKIDENI